MKKATSLKIDWCSAKAATYACKHWHYSRILPVGKLVKVGAWEDGRFIGCVVFGRGASPHLFKQYKLTQVEGCELVRMAFRKHKVEMSKVMSIAFKFLKSACPGIRLIVSFADSAQGHHGGIYQAGNWIYDGVANHNAGFMIRGKPTHRRGLSKYVPELTLENVRKYVDPHAYLIPATDKHRYLMPLDKKLRRKLAPLAQPYPKRAQSIESDAPCNQQGEGGATPTCALHPDAEA